MKQDRHTYRRLILLLTAAAAVFLTVMAPAVSRESPPLVQNEAVVLSGGWTDETGGSAELPVKRAYRAEGFAYETELPPQDGATRYLRFFAKYQNARLYWNGEELGSCLCKPEGAQVTRGKVFVILPLPEEGGTLRIESLPLLGSAIPYEIAAPQLGSCGALSYGMIAQEVPGLLITAAIFCFGLFLLICGLQALRTVTAQEDSQTFQASFLHIGLFALVFSLYSLVITDTIHLFVADPYPLYLLEFFLLALMPLPPLALAAEVCAPRYRRLLTADCCVIFLNFAVQVFLHFVFRFELRRGVTVTHLLMIASVVLLLLALISTGRRENGQWWPLLSFSPVLAGAAADIIRFYLPRFYQKAVGFQLGVLAFLLLQTAYLLRQNLRYYENYLRSNTYRHMAYTDALTGLANRAAFERKLTEVGERPESFSSVWCVSADINNLKQTNDTLGHAAGDVLIRDAAELLRRTAEEDRNVYRIGGDEFVLLLFNRSEEDMRRLRTRLEQAQEEYGKSHSTGLSIAFGCECFRFSEGDTVMKLLSRADALMYENKRQWKARQPGTPGEKPG